MAELGQAPEPAQNAAFLHKDTVLRVVKTGTVELDYTASSGIATTVITHNLGYKPSFVAFWDATVSGNRYSIPTTIIDTPAGTAKYSLIGYTSATALTFEADVPSGSSIYNSAGVSWRIRYYLLAPDAT